MEYKITDISLTEREIEISLPFDEIRTGVETEVKNRTKNIQIAGFRKGKVPLALIKKMYGDAFEFEASEKVANHQFWEIAKDKHLHPIGQPAMTDIKYKPGEDLFFKVKYEVVPKLDVKDYTGLTIEIPKFEVKDDEVESEIKYILKANSTNEPADVVGDDKKFILDVEMKRLDENGAIMEGTKPENIQIDLTSDRVQQEILENSKAKKVGESFSFSFTDEITKKDENGEEKKVSEKYIYSALIKGIKRILIPELNEELIKKATKDKVKNETDLRAEIRKDIQGYYDQKTEEMIQEKLITLIVKSNDFVPPVSLVDNILEGMVKNEEETSKKQGYRKYDKVEGANRLRKTAEYNVKWYLIKEAIQKKEDITITDEELNELAAKDAGKTGIAVDKLINYYKSANYSEKLIDKKMYDFLKEKSNINSVEPEKLLKKGIKEEA